MRTTAVVNRHGSSSSSSSKPAKEIVPVNVDSRSDLVQSYFKLALQEAAHGAVEARGNSSTE